MNRRRLLVLLVILGLLAGGIAHVPVASGTISLSPAYGNLMNYTPPVLSFVANATGVGWSGYYQLLNPTGGYMYTPVLYDDGQQSLSIDGVPFTGTYTIECMYENWPPYTVSWVNARIRIISPPAGSHHYSWYGSRTVLGTYGCYSGDIAAYDTSVWGGGYPGGSEPGPGVYPGDYTPLSVTIDSGPTAVDLIDGGTWHALATGGQDTSYTYAWGYHPIGQGGYFTEWPTAGQTFTHVFSAGTWVIQVKASDSHGETAYADITVTASSVAGSYQAHLQRSGPLGQYMSVNVTDAAGDPVTISSTAGTQYGLYEASGAFGWFTADSEAAQLGGGSYTWRWTMSYTVTPPGLAIVPPADFWFDTSIHLAVPNIDLHVTHHFTSKDERHDPWFPPGTPGTPDEPIVPETPPSPTSTLPDWLAPLWDFLVKLFKALFQPDATEFGKQLAGSWVTIASPVPSITPQYTIPFPNPSHLLAPTGDSVNIDFSGITSYSGYSTYKLIVQVLLDAILVFVVISIIT